MAPRKPSKAKKPSAKMGRPPVYKTPNDLMEAAEKHFNSLREDNSDGTKGAYKEPPTLSGVTLALGFNDRQSLYDQEKRGPEFSCAVKRIRTHVQSFHEARLSGNNPTGSIFFMKTVGGSDFKEPASRHLVSNKPIEEMSEEELVIFLG